MSSPRTSRLSLEAVRRWIGKRRGYKRHDPPTATAWAMAQEVRERMIDARESLEAVSEAVFALCEAAAEAMEAERQDREYHAGSVKALGPAKRARHRPVREEPKSLEEM